MVFFEWVTVFLVVIFIISSASKLAARASFQATLEALAIQKQVAGPLTLIVPVLELVGAAALLIEPLQWMGNLIIAVLLVAFGWSVWRKHRLGKDIQCNCFGELLPEQLGMVTLIRAIILLVADLYVYASEKHDVIWTRPATDWVLAVFISLALLAAYGLVFSFSGVVKSNRKG